MFERRLKVVLMVFVVGWAIVALRLFQLQVIQADHYRAVAQRRLIKYEKTLEPMRGRILDRNGRVLASDEPKWAIAIHYRMLKLHDDAYYVQLADGLLEDSKLLERYAPSLLKLKRATATEQDLIDRQEVIAQWVESEVEMFWQLLSTLSPEESREDLSVRAEGITEVIGRWKAEYMRKEALEEEDSDKAQIREETQCHPMITGLDRQRRIEVQSRLRQRFAWLFDLGAVEIADLSKREYHQAECLAHVVGHQREVTPGDVTERPFRKSEDLGGYRNRDTKGESGVERMCEDRLRGRRGSLKVYRDERPPLRIEPVNGKDVTLTIDFALQSAIYDLLGEAVSDLSEVPGGSVVVLDIPTREVLALVSYPSYDPNTYRSDYSDLSRDVRTFPLHFRAVYRQYEPGSIVKPLTVVAAHGAGLIDAQTRFDCRGRLDPNIKKFRCWVPAGASESIHHGPINSEEAIKRSCNVFCFNLGDLFWKQRGGPEGLQLMSEWMKHMGLGLPTGIGLDEEKYGIAPSPHYLWTQKKRLPILSDPRNYAIGQGEMQVTPLQAANLVATYASGLYRTVSLLKNEQNAPPTSLPVEESVWRIVRRGMYQVANVTGGTATQYAKLENSQYVLCGKSGSAQTTRWITNYRIDYHDENGERSITVPANNKRFAYEEFVRQMMVADETIPRDQAEQFREELRDSIIRATPAAHWPVEASKDRQHSHAWFVAFLQPKGADGQPDWNAQARIAIAVLLEFGGSGGRTSGPVCRDVAEMIINDFPRYVTRQHPLAVRNR